MPRFLHTYTGEFHWVADPSTVMYAILSHTWQPEELGGEQSYASIVELQTRVGHTTNTHSLYIDCSSKTDADRSSIFFSGRLSDKIKNACRVARKAGYQLIWIDSGCINKSSSAELAEAINSMFELYRLANVCFVYLADVPDGEDPRNEFSKFRRSRWHERGWTLQELIAPKNVVFLSRTWTFLGTKNGLASTLEQVTRIDVDILTGKAPVDSASVARRMSWAATRETTRVEDEAYSLLGIFGVHLSPIYGEGRNAFLRLQEEILKHIPDQTIFAWGNVHMEMRSPDSSQYIAFLSRTEGRSMEVRYDWAFRTVEDPIHWHSLLAPSPLPFRNAHNAVSVPPSDFASRLDLSNSGVRMPPLRCVFTPQGVGLTLLAVSCAKGSPFSWIARDLDRPVLGCAFHGGTETCRHTQGAVEYLALLQCEAKSSTGRLVIALALLRPTSEVEQNMGLHVATRPCHCGGSKSCRLVYISPAALDTIRRHLVPTELNLRRTLSPPASWLQEVAGDVDSFLARISLWPELCTRFCVAPWCEEQLGALGFAVSPLQIWVEKKDQVQTRIVLTSSLTFHQSAQAQGTAKAIEITLSLTQDLSRFRKQDTICRFSIKNSFCDTVQSRKLRDSPEVKFDTRYIPLTMRERAIHVAVFDVFEDLVGTDSEEQYQDQRQNRRLLRLSLECPLRSSYPPTGSTGRYVIDVPCLWILIELSDVIQSVRLQNVSEDHSDIMSSPTGSTLHKEPDAPTTTYSTELTEHSLKFKRMVGPQGISPMHPLPLHIPTSMGLRGRLTPFKRFLGNAGLQALRQPKKFVEYIRGRGRKAEGSPPRS
ncbi:HET-domain-containing protein [Trametes versicolor FP-101664 SS1]|uniref:HET-domain-containing protein n=1 Tax=Trametes versicolor (strain FP-101664) TaxID=717944 RepID=UPI00046213B6|nr:HET-domain-containing protein [Trametes versicolor FP-101664 SS1]EIW61115.1 HET-domain-containing protein [Trametes versicolor FP-101664 SS1]